MNAKIISYNLTGEEVAADAKWRREKVCGIDKEYCIIHSMNNSHTNRRALVLRVSSDTAILFKMRYKDAEIKDI